MMRAGCSFSGTTQGVCGSAQSMSSPRPIRSAVSTIMISQDTTTWVRLLAFIEPYPVWGPGSGPGRPRRRRCTSGRRGLASGACRWPAASGTGLVLAPAGTGDSRNARGTPAPRIGKVCAGFAQGCRIAVFGFGGEGKGLGCGRRCSRRSGMRVGREKGSEEDEQRKQQRAADPRWKRGRAVVQRCVGVRRGRHV